MGDSLILFSILGGLIGIIILHAIFTAILTIFHKPVLTSYKLNFIRNFGHRKTMIIIWLISWTGEARTYGVLFRKDFIESLGATTDYDDILLLIALLFLSDFIRRKTRLRFVEEIVIHQKEEHGTDSLTEKEKRLIINDIELVKFEKSKKYGFTKSEALEIINK